MTPSFWNGRSVFVTGHTGFKGAWLTSWLLMLGARVSGYALPPSGTPSLFALLAEPDMVTTFGDIRHLDHLHRAMSAANPEVVLHLAAQSLVRPSYADPVGTYATNVMGTVHVLEAIRHTPSVQAAVMVTSDKCYDNDGRAGPYSEADRLGGSDPYSNSKGCAELVTAAYRASFFAGGGCRVASARAGNVIGGGDWSVDRLIPDILRARNRGEPVAIRAPDAVRPWQHVLEPLAGYLDLAEALCGENARSFAEGWNFGPDPDDRVPVRQIVTQCCQALGVGWTGDAGPHPPEAALLSIDSTKARRRLGWKPRLSIRQAVQWTVDWHNAHDAAAEPRDLTRDQIEAYSR